MLTHCAKLLLLLSMAVPAAMGLPNPAQAGGPCIVETSIVESRKFEADICLPNPSGPDFELDFELEFHLDPENPGSLVNLTVPCVGFSVEILDAAAIADVESRLPDPANQSIDPALPLRVTIEPPVACGLEFEDDYDVEFDAGDLTWVPQSPYRLMKAPIGGSYQDITALVDPGSVRSRGCGGTFSEFVMIIDTDQDYASEAAAAFTDLGITLGNAAIGPTASTTLGNDRSVSQSAFVAGNYAEAIARLDDMDEHCGTLGGPALPNRWRSARDLENVEGEVVSRSGHLKFLLGRLNGDP